MIATIAYHCQHCEAKAEVLQKTSDAPLKTCPHCGQVALKRKFYSLKSATHDGSYTHCACGKKEHCG